MSEVEKNKEDAKQLELNIQSKADYEALTSQIAELSNVVTSLVTNKVEADKATADQASQQELAGAMSQAGVTVEQRDGLMKIIDSTMSKKFEAFSDEQSKLREADRVNQPNVGDTIAMVHFNKQSLESVEGFKEYLEGGTSITGDKYTDVYSKAISSSNQGVIDNLVSEFKVKQASTVNENNVDSKDYVSGLDNLDFSGRGIGKGDFSINSDENPFAKYKADKKKKAEESRSK